MLLGISVCCQAFYLPGVAPQDYAKVGELQAQPALQRVQHLLIFALSQGDTLFLKVNKLSSTKTQLPYEYYSIPYCRPEKIVSNAENLGEVLRGDRIENSPYEVVVTEVVNNISAANAACEQLQSSSLCLQIEIRVDQQCKFLCRINALSSSQAEAFGSKIEDEYRVNM